MSDTDHRPRPITLAVMAMGGQGGGVLSDWVASVAEANDYLAQTTSVPGVAQRTGATIYYIELFSARAAREAKRDPVLALMPFPGDVDILIAAEFMEAGRALQQGLITPERTTVIASSHRVYGITEKSAQGNGILDPEPIRHQVREAAKTFIEFDMDRVAQRHGSVISAVLFGALAGSEVLPFPREAFEEAIRRGGIGVESSLRAFDAGLRHARGETPAPVSSSEEGEARPNGEGPLLLPEVQALLERIDTCLPAAAHLHAREGVRRLVDYQDLDYARDYLEQLEGLAAAEQKHAGESPDFPVTAEAARHLALWMSFEDSIRVADLKIRRDRFRRVRDEVKARPEQIVYTTEFMHPRIEEIGDTLPAGLGNWLLRTPWARRPLARMTRRGRRVKTDRLSGFLLLLMIAGMRRFRRRTLRYRTERRHIDAWLARVREMLGRDPALAREVVLAQRLVKGYGDTHARGMARFQALMDSLDHLGEVPDGAERFHQLSEAALADETGQALDRELGHWFPDSDEPDASRRADRIAVRQV